MKTDGAWFTDDLPVNAKACWPTDGRRIGVHAAHQSLVPVGGDQQDSDIELFLCEIIFR